MNENTSNDDATKIAAQSNSMLAKPAFSRTSGKEKYQMKISRAKKAPTLTKAQKVAQHSIFEIVQEIKNFEDGLTQDEEAFMAIIGGPSGSAIFLNGIIPLGLDKVVFVGQNERGQKARLIQHVSQINIMLQSVPIAPEIEPRRFGIGFHASLDEEIQVNEEAEVDEEIKDDNDDEIKPVKKKKKKK